MMGLSGLRGRWLVGLMVACLAASACCSAAAGGPVGEENGIIRQGPYLLCGDDKAMLHVLYNGRPLVHGMGIFCGINGYTKPDDLNMQEVIREKGRYCYRGTVRGQDITFEQTASVADGRIRVEIRRTGAWPEGVWGSFQIRLPVSRYGGAQYRADGQTRVFPETFSPDNEFPGGTRRLECHLGEPELDLVIECANGISIGDHRRFNAPFYVLGIGVPTGERDTTEFFITLPDLPDAPPRRAVRWSRIGYPLAGEKFAVLEWSKYDPRPEDRVRLENRAGDAVKEGRFGETQSVEHIQGSYATFDFSDVRQPGEYRVVWSGGATDWFPIRRNVFEDRLWEPTLDCFIPFEMCHADVNLGSAVTGHPKCHMDDGARVPAHFRGPDGFVSYDCEGTPYAAGEHVPCAKGGWHDAGDYDVNVHANGFTTWVLALAYEEFGLERDVATLDAEAQTFTAGQPDGVPDVLQQIEWGALWLLSMQQADGRVYNGVCANEAQRAGKPLGQIHDGVPGTGGERQVYVDYHGDSQLCHVISLAAASRALKDARPELAQRCLNAARKSFEYFRRHEPVYRAGGYASGAPNGGEDRAMAIAAATELYLTRGDPQYVAVIEELADCLPDLKFDWPLPRDTGPGNFWFSAPFLARLCLRLPEGDLKQAVLAACRRAATIKAERVGVRPWPFLWYHFGPWGNNGACAARAFDTYWLTRVAPDILPPDSALRNMLWIFGLHPTCDTVFVCGLGYPDPQHLYSSHLHELFGYAPASVPGAIVPGMGGFWNSGVVAYIDEHGNYGHNEACIYTQAAYIFAVNAMKKLGY